jgi:hypothetical protein
MILQVARKTVNREIVPIGVIQLMRKLIKKIIQTIHKTQKKK